MSIRPIEDVLAEWSPRWMDISGVAGTGVGLCQGDPCIVIYASERTAAMGERIPEEIEGYHVRIEETGPFRARDPNHD